MCGIAGIITKQSNLQKATALRRMTDALSHRGPDGDGHWNNQQANVFLGHRRLSIIDLSESASQPMDYRGRYKIIFNGEIYNYLEIKQRLLNKGYEFNTQSDTEVILALFDEQREKCLHELDGMFAFAIYDNKTGSVFIARDRFGEKPLFYTYNNEGDLFFASEMKAFWKTGLPKTANKAMVFKYMLSNLIEDPEDKQQTFYEGIYKLPAAHYAMIETGQLSVHPVRYWDIDPTVRNETISEQEASERFQQLFYTSVSRRLRSDVPVGSSLSGGLDSSLVVCAIDQIDKEKNITRKTFSAQFPGFEKDESYYQQLVTSKCHVEPHFVYPTAESMLANLDKVIYYQEEPFGSASICVQYEVFELAKKNNVTVLLDGQGADEVLAGYHSYYKSFFKGLKQRNPALYRKEREAYYQLHADNKINVQHRQKWKDDLRQLVPESIQDLLLKRRRKNYSGEAFLNQQLVRQYGNGHEKLYRFSGLQESLFFDTTKLGLEFLLRFADRNSMAHGREVRLPFLNPELVEFLFSLPDSFKIRGGWTKWIMRRSFETILPEQITWRKDKIGYEPPQEQWMSDPGMQPHIKKAISAFADHGILKDGKMHNGYNNLFKWKVFICSKNFYL